LEVSFKTLQAIALSAAAGVRPPERLSVSQASEKYRKLENQGSYVGPWKNSMTPYLTEPMDVLNNREYTGMIFVGPAQCGKTDMFLNWQLYSVICDPADMMLIQTAQDTARDFSIRRVDRLHRHTPLVGDRLIARRDADNTFDKKYQSGMLLTLSWPTINQLSGRPVPRLWLTDYDRMVEDVDGEGSPFDLARKRATSFRSHGMCAAESSPGKVITNTKWQRKTKHEAPPTGGILGLYNRGDRRLFYWHCISCHNAFEPNFNLLSTNDSADEMEQAEAVTMACPHCGQVYSHNPSISGDEGPGKHTMNAEEAAWVKDGQTWTPEKEIVGEPFRSDIASFWLKGVCAAFSDWKTLWLNWLKAEKEYEDSGSETALKTTINVDQGLPYLPKSQANARIPDQLKARAKDFGMKVVPWGVRFLIATIDLQKNRFEVQVHGIGPGGDIWVIDRFYIQKSARRDKDDPTQLLWVNPGAYSEDWKLLVKQVLKKTYPLGDGSGREMAIMHTVCDSGGSEGFTANAYEFVRWLKTGRSGDDQQSDADQALWEPTLAGRFTLLKGASNDNAPRAVISYPDSQRKDRHAGARGEIPVLMINTQMQKDRLNSMLDRVDPRGGCINFPDWLGSSFYSELCVEVKDPKKGWINPKGYRNESWDLLVYCLSAILLPTIMAEYIDWDYPQQGWAKEWSENDLVFDPKVEDKPFDNMPGDDYDLSALAAELA